MKNPLKIFYITPEVSPFAETSELATIANSFPKRVKSLGHDIRVMMPNYKEVNERKYVLRDVIRLQGLKIQLGDQVLQANGKSAFIPESKVQIYFLDNKQFFHQNKLMAVANDEITVKLIEQSLFFCIGCMETLKLLYWQPDIIHCNDWQTALIPLLLKSVYADDAFFKNSRTLLTVHSFLHHGMAKTTEIRKAGFPNTALSMAHELTEKNVNFLQVGIKYADMVVSSNDINDTEVKNTIFKDKNISGVVEERMKDFRFVSNSDDELSVQKYVKLYENLQKMKPVRT